MNTVLTKAELAERWKVETRTIDKWENEKKISRVPGIPAPRYSLDLIEKIEGLDNKNEFSPLERRRMQKQLEILEDENRNLKAIISRILAESSKIVGM